MKTNLEFILTNNITIVDKWFSSKMSNNTPIYTSVDIRNSGFKTAPVDTNLFPSGFNNLTKSSQNKASQLLYEFLQTHYSKAHNIAICAESFTRNANYWQHIKTLVQLLSEKHINIRVVILNDEKTIKEIAELSGIDIYSIITKDNFLFTSDNWPIDLVILNNDLTDGPPREFNNSQTIITPSPHRGWFYRSKFKHFLAYKNIATEFCKQLSLDPWLLSTYVDISHNICFREKKGFNELATKIDSLLTSIENKYREYNINKRPYVLIKADHGTLGRGIISIHNSDELFNLSKKDRYGINTIKGNVINKNILIQEGIETIETYNNYSSEHTIYSIKGQVAGGFTRYNTIKNNEDNLNSKGMIITPQKNISVVESILARLATLATMYE